MLRAHTRKSFARKDREVQARIRCGQIARAMRAAQQIRAMMSRCAQIRAVSTNHLPLSVTICRSRRHVNAHHMPDRYHYDIMLYDAHDIAGVVTLR